MRDNPRYQSAIIIGASSGIGRALAKVLSDQQIRLGLMARREDQLISLAQELNGPAWIRPCDISDADAAKKQLELLIQEMGEVDLVFISSGMGEINPEWNWEIEKKTILVNVLGVTAMMQTALHHFLERKRGHLAVVTSIAALRGSAEGTVYNASKSFLCNYLEGLQISVKKHGVPVSITDIRPGFVDTEMAKGDGLFWVQPVEKATRQIWLAILKRKPVVYITKRWRLIAIILKSLPRWLICRM